MHQFIKLCLIALFVQFNTLQLLVVTSLCSLSWQIYYFLVSERRIMSSTGPHKMLEQHCTLTTDTELALMSHNSCTTTRAATTIQLLMVPMDLDHQRRRMLGHPWMRIAIMIATKSWKMILITMNINILNMYNSRAYVCCGEGLSQLLHLLSYLFYVLKLFISCFERLCISL